MTYFIFLKIEKKQYNHEKINNIFEHLDDKFPFN